MSLVEIEAAVKELTPEELTKLAAFIARQDNLGWDAQIEEDFSPSGKHAAVLERVDAEIDKGKGLHSRPEFSKNCDKCHLDHREGKSKLIDWRQYGGMENFPRFLETWGAANTFTYNGSMVKMFSSLYATNVWGKANVYSPPKRNWAYDVNFNDATKLPPLTPSLLKVFRGQWATVAPNTTVAHVAN